MSQQPPYPYPHGRRTRRRTDQGRPAPAADHRRLRTTVTAIEGTEATVDITRVG